MSQTKDNKKAITVGIFLFIGIAIFLLGVFTLGGQRKTFVKSFQLSVIFNDIQGLKIGNNVWFSGVKVGTIKKIQFYGTSQVKVTLSVEEEAHRYIHKNAKASIGSDGLIGNKIVVIDGGSPKFPFIEDGDVIAVNTTLSTDDIMKTLQVNNKNLLDITSNFKILAKDMVDGKGTVGALLTDQKIADNFKAIVANLQNTTLAANKMALQLNAFSNKLNTKGGLADKMLTDTLVFAKFQNSVAEFQKTATSAAALTENLNKASAKLNDKDNVAGVMLNDPAAADQIRSTIKNLQTSSEKLDQDLEALQHNFLLRGFFKKKAKEAEKQN
ncbi:MCE family protein [Pedobacter sp. SD-b]|uniref:MCE family protein n=1 Tax=Pedobacter segetis TaxID=2793069 RepID=A0ABS1BF19_9SPHI|nr:MlaD family protein [Pedobacter segetis]MBK0381465.1 MCE family protein [Pedobacter segetis]